MLFFLMGGAVTDAFATACSDRSKPTTVAIQLPAYAPTAAAPACFLKISKRIARTVRKTDSTEPTKKNKNVSVAMAVNPTICKVVMVASVGGLKNISPSTFFNMLTSRQ